MASFRISPTNLRICEEAVRRANQQARAILDDHAGEFLATISGTNRSILLQGWNPFAIVLEEGYHMEIHVEDWLTRQFQVQTGRTLAEIATKAVSTAIVKNSKDFVTGLLEGMFNG